MAEAIEPIQPPASVERLGVGTLVCYLLGRRSAILSIAADRHSLWIGVLFVFSAAFAREYDAEDLLHEPVYLTIPLLASLASSFALFALVYAIAIRKGEPWQAFPSRYLAFLGLFWMTAPLAWLYAIPYERFLSPIDSTAANLITLGVVSLWRVTIMMRVMQLVFGYSRFASLGLVMLFADAVALILIAFSPVPLIDVMSGDHITQSEALTREAALAVLQVGVCALPCWFLISAFHVYESSPRWQVVTASRRPHLGMIVLALASLAVWLPILPRTQPEQQRRRVIEQLYESGDVAGTLARLSNSAPSDYPPHWQPPAPKDKKYLSKKEWLPLLEYLSADDVAPWVRQKYIERFRSELLDREGGVRLGRTAQPLGDALERIPEGRALLGELERHPNKRIINRLKGREEPKR